MNRKRWIYAGVLGLAAVAFVVDRVFLGTPAAAEAQQTSPRPNKPRPAPAKPPQEPPVMLDPSLAWLSKLVDVGGGRDVFSPSPEWLASQREKTEAAQAAQVDQGPLPGSSEAFEAAHKLQATTVMGRGGLAVVDGQCLSTGDTLDGFRLVRVQAGRVEFRRGKERVTLSLPMPPPGRCPESDERPAGRRVSQVLPRYPPGR